MLVTQLKSRTLSEIWYALLLNAIEHGRIYKVSHGPNQGRKRLELDMVHLQIVKPAEEFDAFIERQIIGPEYLNEYIEMIKTRGKNRGDFWDRHFDNRLVSPLVLTKQNLDWSIDLTPLGLLIQMYKLHGFKTNRACISMANAQDIAVNPSPCFRVLDTKVLDDKLNFIIYVRSWDVLQEMPEDLAILEKIKQYVASEISAQNGELIVSAKGVHIYEQNWKKVEELTGKQMESKL